MGRGPALLALLAALLATAAALRNPSRDADLLPGVRGSQICAEGLQGVVLDLGKLLDAACALLAAHTQLLLTAPSPLPGRLSQAGARSGAASRRPPPGGPASRCCTRRCAGPPPPPFRVYSGTAQPSQCQLEGEGRGTRCLTCGAGQGRAGQHSMKGSALRRARRSASVPTGHGAAAPAHITRPPLPLTCSDTQARVFLFHGFLTDAETEHLIAKAEPRLERSGVVETETVRLLAKRLVARLGLHGTCSVDCVICASPCASAFPAPWAVEVLAGKGAMSKTLLLSWGDRVLFCCASLSYKRQEWRRRS